MKKNIIILLIQLFTTNYFAQEVQKFEFSPSLRMDGIFVENDTIYTVQGASGALLQKISPDGKVTTKAFGLGGPIGLTKDSEGSFYTSNYRIGGVTKISADGSKSTYANIVGATGSIIFDKNGNMFVAHTNNPNSTGGGNITKVAKDGTVTLFASGAPLEQISSLAFDDNGNLYSSNLFDGKICKIDENGNAEVLATIPSQSRIKAAKLVYGGGFLYSTDLNANKIYKISLTGEVSHFAGTGTNGSDGNTIDNVQFSNPNGLFYSDNKLYVVPATKEYNYIQIINLSNPTSVDEKFGDNLPNVFELHQNYPNPFNPTTTIQYSLKENANVKLALYDNLGQQIKVLVNQNQSIGLHNYSLDASNLSSGNYIYKIDVGNFSESKKMILLK